MKKHNGYIALWKFIFAVGILLFHCAKKLDYGDSVPAHFLYASIGVDFFFLVSGYLLMKKTESERERGDDRPLAEATVSFIRGKAEAIFPYLLLSWLLRLFVELLFERPGATEVLESFFAELMFLVSAAKPDYILNSVTWYVSAMLLAMLLIYPLCRKYGRGFALIIAPLIGLFVGGFLVREYSSLSLRDWKKNTGFMTLGLMKAVAEISLGTFVYMLSEKLKMVRFTRFGRLTLMLLGNAALGAVFIVNLGSKNVWEYDILFVLLLMSGIGLCFSDEMLFDREMRNGFCYFLEKVSLPFYLNNFILIRLANRTERLLKMSLKERYALVLIGNFLLSVLSLSLVEGIRRAVKKRREKTRLREDPAADTVGQ